MTDFTPFDFGEMIGASGLRDLYWHAKQKLHEEEQFYTSHAKRGTRPHGRRNDRRPLWQAVVALCDLLKEECPAHFDTRQEVWAWLLPYASEVTAIPEQFVALLDLHRLLSLPSPYKEAELERRQDIRKKREVAARRERAQHLLQELSGLQSEETDLPDNVIPLRGAR